MRLYEAALQAYGNLPAGMRLEVDREVEKRNKKSPAAMEVQMQILDSLGRHLDQNPGSPGSPFGPELLESLTSQCLQVRPIVQFVGFIRDSCCVLDTTMAAGRQKKKLSWRLLDAFSESSSKTTSELELMLVEDWNDDRNIVSTLLQQPMCRKHILSRALLPRDIFRKGDDARSRLHARTLADVKRMSRGAAMEFDNEIQAVIKSLPSKCKLSSINNIRGCLEDIRLHCEGQLARLQVGEGDPWTPRVLVLTCLAGAAAHITQVYRSCRCLGDEMAFMYRCSCRSYRDGSAAPRMCAYSDRDFKPLFDAFMAVHEQKKNVDAAAINSHLASSPGQAKVKSDELEMKFREDTTVTLDDGRSVMVPAGRVIFKAKKKSGEYVLCMDQKVDLKDRYGLSTAQLITFLEVDSSGSAMRLLDAGAADELFAVMQQGNISSLSKKVVALTRQCVFCGKKLTDENSIGKGSGSICTRRYGEHGAHLDAALPDAAIAHVRQAQLSHIVDVARQRRSTIRSWLEGVMQNGTMGTIRSDILETLVELIKSNADADADDDGLGQLLQYLKELCGFDTVAEAEQACADMARVAGSEQRWLPVIAGANSAATPLDMSRFLGTCKLAEHLGHGSALVEWLVASLPTVCIYAHAGKGSAFFDADDDQGGDLDGSSTSDDDDAGA
jgi:hypothetical protein